MSPFLRDDGSLVLAEWGNRLGARHRGDVPMYGTRAMADRLVSNGMLGVDLIHVPAGEGFAPHTHPGDHLLIVVEGRGTITYEGVIYPTRAGQVYLIEGAVPHAVGAATDHKILAVGAPHREPDAADRMTLTEYAAVAADLGRIRCLQCDAVGTVEELRAGGCTHTPPDAGTGRPLAVGLAPARPDQPAAFVGTRSGDRLARLVGLQDSLSLPVAFDTANLAPTFLGYEPMKVPMGEWRELADALLPSCSERVVVACGETVASALTGVRHASPWGQADVLDVPGGKPALLVTIPHPSGLSRSWNDAATAERCRVALNLARTFARCEPPRGSWCAADAELFTAAVMEPRPSAEHRHG